ncbi:NAD(P)H-dependent oxidoreductase subunit E [Gandjariella thermophila]|uniref:NADH-ubiquinone oxidoreductase 51kDa subunit iron-sulphur binding domain-containing protein n=1 Tax=Gandjariella thermophila TaxID=1931992 RepID=A0A4D4JEG3_9PSEU|nr:NAD(P)H-dependent oxidoreductase subunit E [Gandjariella thermophila]GDY33802.1 hypothetical protein GTS_54350 [Gandjariella thermophila]
MTIPRSSAGRGADRGIAHAREAFVEWQARRSLPVTELLDRLRHAHDRSGVIGDDDKRRIAAERGWPDAAVEGAASFYADLASRRGRRHVRVCRGTSCFAATGGRHVAQAEAALGVRCGQCEPSGSVSLDAVYCLGYCYASPAALDGNQPVVGCDVAERLASGPPASAAAPPVPLRVAGDRAVILAGLRGEARPWEVWPDAVTSRSPGDIRAEVGVAGLRGRGGAEFPVAAKWQAAARYVVANGDEGDPGSYCDRLLMEDDPHRVLEGLALAGLATGARRGFVFVRSEYPAAVTRMGAAVIEARQAGHLGTDVHGSGVDFDVEVVAGAGSYVAGEETALLHALAGLRGAVRPRPPYPTTWGLVGRPTVVNNVETLAAVPWIVRHGGAAYARLGHARETGTKLVCLSERFRRPGVYEVPFGVPLRLLVDDLGGGLRDGRTLRALQVGGPLGGFLSPDQLDLPLLAGVLADAGVALGHGSLVAVDDTVPARDLLRHLWTFAASESCGACTPCRVGSRRGLELADGSSSPGWLAVQDELLDVLAVGSLCAFGRGVAGAVRSLVRVYGDELGAG